MTYKCNFESPSRSRRCRWILATLMYTTLMASAATIAEPDNIVFGVVTRFGQPIPADTALVSVEARRTADGAMVATYRLGENPAYGDAYALRIPSASVWIVSQNMSAFLEDTMDLVVWAGQDRFDFANAVTLTERGQTYEVNLEIGNIEDDSDNDGLPDAWEIHHFGDLSQSGSSLNSNGFSTRENYVAGTDPNAADSAFAVEVTLINGSVTVFFPTLTAAGVGYEGVARYYTLEVVSDFWAPWETVPGYANLLGDNQTVVYSESSSSAPLFYRVRVSLAPGP